jgi:hemolysin activation/secretion protein
MILGSITHGTPQGALAAADINSDSWALGTRLSWPWIRTRAQSISLDAGFTAQGARVSILGTRVNRDQWRVFDASLSYSSDRLLGGNFSATTDVAQGLPILGASSNHSPDLSLGGRSVFTKITGLARYTRAIAAPLSIALSASGQYAFQPLINGEQVLFGGTQIGRGYDPGAITGDSGAGGSVELRYDMRIPGWDAGNMEPYVFFDGAKVWSQRRALSAGIPLADYSIASTGAGLRFWLPYNIYLDLEGARTLRAVPGSDGGKATTKFLVDLAVAY